MVSSSSYLLAAAATAATFVPLGALADTAEQFVNAVWSTSSFETISGTTGNEIGHDGGFSLIDENGETIWSSSYPGDYAPCQTSGGHTFHLSGGCFPEGVNFGFKCTSDVGGTPESCEVFDSGDNSLGTAGGNVDTNFFGIGISIEGYCGLSFALGPNTQCLPASEGFEVS